MSVHSILYKRINSFVAVMIIALTASLAGGVLVWHIGREAEGFAVPNLAATRKEKILSSYATVKGCRIKVETTRREFFLETNFFPEYHRCYQFLRSSVSPSGLFVVFQDLSGGVDSMLRVYSLKEDQTVTIGVFGTSEIFDICFLPEDKIAMLNGWEGEKKYLKVFDLPSLFEDYPENVHPEYNIFTNTDQHSKLFSLPEEEYRYMEVKKGQLRIYGFGGRGSDVVHTYPLEQVVDF